MRRLTIGTRDGGTRDLVLRTFVDPFYVECAEDWLSRETGAVTLLVGTGVLAPGPDGPQTEARLRLLGALPAAVERAFYAQVAEYGDAVVKRMSA